MFKFVVFFTLVLLTACDTKLHKEIDDTHLRPESITKEVTKGLLGHTPLNAISHLITPRLLSEIEHYGDIKQYSRILLDIKNDPDAEISTYVLDKNNLNDLKNDLKLVIAIQGRSQHHSLYVAHLVRHGEQWHVDSFSIPSVDMKKRFGIVTY